MTEPPAYLLHKLVFELDHAADKVLREHFGISYKRALFLLTLQREGTLTQHKLAIALGYSDPAISVMLVTLAKDGYVTIVVSPEHKRKRLVSITPKGTELVVKGVELLDSQYNELITKSHINGGLYNELTEQLYKTVRAKTKREQS